MEKRKIARVELDCYDSPIHCIFCGKRIINLPPPDTDEDTSNTTIQPCEHTLFVATDEGFEYRSGRFDEVLKKSSKGTDDDDDSYDSITDNLDISNAIKLAIYVPPPGFWGSYVGFAMPERIVSKKEANE